MTPEQVTQRLENISFMFNLSAALRPRIADALLEVSRLEHLGPDTVLLSPDESESEAGFVLLAGGVEVQGNDGFARALEPPVILGEMKQFHFEQGSRRMATVRTVCEVQALRFSWPELYAFLERHISAKEIDEFRMALQEHAWMHYLELQDEL